MTERRDPGKDGQNETPNNTAPASAPLPTPPENDRVRDFDAEADTVRIECLFDRREKGPHQD